MGRAGRALKRPLVNSMMTVWFAIVGLFILALFGWLFAWYTHQQLNKVKQQLLTVEKTLRSELTSLSSGAIGVGQRIIAAEKRLGNLQSLQESQQQMTPENKPYQQAESLIAQGADVNQLVEQCGLSEAEAQLMTMMKKGEGTQQSH